MKNLRYFCETLLVASAAWLLPRLPRSVILAMSKGVGFAAYHLDIKGRKTALENLRVAFQGEYTLADRQRIARQSYQTFARTFLDLFWAASLTHETWQQHITIQMCDAQAEATARETGGVWVTPHFGNFEFVSLIWGFRGIPFTVVAQDFKNPGLTAIFKRLREHSGHTVIPQESAMLKLMKALKRKGHAGLLTDLNISPGKAATAIRCFGLLTCVPTLHVQLAMRLGLSIMTGVCLPLPDGRYQVSIFEALRPQPDEDVTIVTQRVWDHFEKAIRKNPECWLWMYKHWRYLPSRGTYPDYPTYAKPSRKFTAMLETMGLAEPPPPAA
ncbi:LpxL/LpxP family acyltransferase [Prosthecobacter dejongeii]|uniref:Lauroyl/myristoyl acyltransferase n=1 Tax=Prosthecobacter dejongeii TaxID=48465 RepID=A0A7W8DQ17_9BACT|nr:lauroyl/myristoyl acyltransferase [Prosthecobacter dejongeii]